MRKLPKPSPEQNVVINHVRQLTGNVFCNSCAGSGKTTTNELVIEHAIPPGASVLYLVFATKNAKEFRAKKGMGETQKTITLPNGVNLQVDTCHAFGFGVVRRARGRVDVKPDKIYKLCDKLQCPQEYRSFVNEAVKQAKSRLFGFKVNIDDVAAWQDLVDHFAIDERLESKENGVASDNQMSFENLVAEAIQWSIRLLKASRAETVMIDYDDQIYEPLASKMRFPKYDYVLLDEAQDSDEARRALVAQALKPGGLAMFVGDRYQAIMGFAGADNDSVDKIIKDFNCTELSLSVSFRCSKAVVREAAKICPTITPYENALEGEVIPDVAYDDMIALAKTMTHDDVILCRKTKPLVSTAFTLLKNGIACYVEGKDIGGQVTQWLDKWKRVKTLDALRNKLEDYRDKMVGRYMAKNQEDKADRLNDILDTLLVLMEGCDTIQCVRDKIDRMFIDEQKAPKRILSLSTVHKSKGREWNRVFILGFDEYMPSKYARSAWQQKQEQCLIYVAQTRSKDKLYYVRDMAKNDRPQGQ